MKGLWLASVGLAIPKLSVRWHTYFRTRRKWELGSFNHLGISLVWTSYRRSKEENYEKS